MTTAKEMGATFRTAAQAADPDHEALLLARSGLLSVRTWDTSEYEAARTVSRTLGAIAAVYEGIARAEEAAEQK